MRAARAGGNLRRGLSQRHPAAAGIYLPLGWLVIGVTRFFLPGAHGGRIGWDVGIPGCAERRFYRPPFYQVEETQGSVSRLAECRLLPRAEIMGGTLEVQLVKSDPITIEQDGVRVCFQNHDLIRPLSRLAAFFNADIRQIVGAGVTKGTFELFMGNKTPWGHVVILEGSRRVSDVYKARRASWDSAISNRADNL